MEKIELLDRSIIAGKSARIGLDMHNNGTTTVDNIKVLMDGRSSVKGAVSNEPNITLATQTFETVRPGETKRVEFTVTCPTPGPTSIRAQVSSTSDSLADELKGDDTIELALNVRKAVRVLVVDGGWT